MNTEERIKILDKAKKLKALADRGVGGEKENAYRMLNAYMAKHNITENELKHHRHNEETFKGLTKEEIYRQFEEEMNMKGMMILGKGMANVMRNRDKMMQFKGRANPKPIEIDWRENEKNFTVKGFINNVLIFDIQLTKKGAVLYPSMKFELQQDMEFKSLDEAKKYCESMKGYFGNTF